MHSRARQAVVPIYLFACLILGGSAQGIWQNMVLQLAGVAIIGWAAASSSDESLPPSARHLLAIAALAIAVVAIQLIPLPLWLWAQLGPREALARQYGILGMHPSGLPLSLNPYGSLDSMLGLIPPLAIVCAMVRLKAYGPTWLALALLAGTAAGILLGALQVASSRAAEAPWYLYEETNVGIAVGFFANANHMATLQLIGLPFLAAAAAAWRARAAPLLGV